jgi:hypothetical protein
MRLGIAEPEQVFRSVVTLHLAFVFAAITYVVVGEVINWSDVEFEGYVFSHDSGTKMVLRLVFLLIAVLDGILVFGVFGRDSYLEKLMLSRAKKLASEPDSADLVGALQQRQLSHDAWASMVACFGIILYVLGGERIDLYGFCVASIVALLLTWPRRSGWEDAFRTLSQRYPAVPSNPWRPELATR